MNSNRINTININQIKGRNQQQEWSNNKNDAINKMNDKNESKDEH